MDKGMRGGFIENKYLFTYPYILYFFITGQVMSLVLVHKKDKTWQAMYSISKVFKGTEAHNLMI